jgi:transcriptional regulator with GAF, ATPase, and Fis domain
VKNQQVDLIDQFADLVLGADNPRRLAERTVEVVMSLNNGRSGAVFSTDEHGLSLFASRGIDQVSLDSVRIVWDRYREAIQRGETFYVTDRATDRRLTQEERAQKGIASFAVVPVHDESGLRALLYVDSYDPHFCESHDLMRLTKLSRIVVKAVTEPESPVRFGGAGSETAWETYLERTPVEDMEREKLLLLLNRNEWNIARVARLMGVTRRTIYLRLARYKIPRERVPKTRGRRSRAS